MTRKLPVLRRKMLIRLASDMGKFCHLGEFLKILKNLLESGELLKILMWITYDIGKIIDFL